MEKINETSHVYLMDVSIAGHKKMSWMSYNQS